MYMRFPGLKIHSHISTECLQCTQDEHTPKLYSSTNNMDPDPLQASTCSYSGIEVSILYYVLIIPLEGVN